MAEPANSHRLGQTGVSYPPASASVCDASECEGQESVQPLLLLPKDYKSFRRSTASRIPSREDHRTNNV